MFQTTNQNSNNTYRKCVFAPPDTCFTFWQPVLQQFQQPFRTTSYIVQPAEDQKKFGVGWQITLFILKKMSRLVKPKRTKKKCRLQGGRRYTDLGPVILFLLCLFFVFFGRVFPEMNFIAEMRWQMVQVRCCREFRPKSFLLFVLVAHTMSQCYVY